MKKDALLRIRHMMESIEKIEMFLEGFSYDDFDEDLKTQDAVLRNVATIGEAANAVNKILQLKYNEISWKKIIGMRHVLIHNYAEADIEQVWSVCKNDLPVLKEQLENILKNE